MHYSDKKGDVFTICWAGTFFSFLGSLTTIFKLFGYNDLKIDQMMTKRNYFVGRNQTKQI